MGQEQVNTGSIETPVVFPAIPWLRDGTEYDGYLESAVDHAKNQDTTAEMLPLYMTETIPDDVEITKVNQMDLITPKLNDIIDAFLETEATHLWFLNADNEVPSHALQTLLDLDVDVASGISPIHGNWMWTTAVYWASAPTPQMLASTPYFKPYRLVSIENKVVGDRQMVASGHFCMLVKRHVFDHIRFRWKQYKMRTCKCGKKIRCLKQEYGSEYTFWMDAQMLGYECRIDGNVVVGHLPQYPLDQYDSAGEK